MTLDAKIAPPPDSSEGHKTAIPRSEWITGEAARGHVQELRHRSDAILVGVGTILADDPLLTDRSGRSRRRPLLRVVLDSSLRTPLDSRLLQSVNEQDVLIFCSPAMRHAANDQTKRFEDRGVRIEPVASSTNGRLDLPSILRRLGELEITSVMIEGGSAINAAAIAARIVDKLFLFYAPKIMALRNAVPFMPDGEVHTPINATQVSLHRFGDDIAIEGYLRDPYEKQSRNLGET